MALQLRSKTSVLRLKSSPPVMPHGTARDRLSPADIPWVIAFPKSSEYTDPQSGYYAVYLFASDGKFVNLSLGIGTQNVGNRPTSRSIPRPVWPR